MLLTKKKVFKLSAVALVLCGAFSQSLASTSGNVTIQSGDATLETIDASAQYGDLSIVNGGGGGASYYINDSAIYADSLTIGVDGGARVSFTNRGTINVGTLNIYGNKTLTGNVSADTIVFHGYGDTSFPTLPGDAESFGSNVSTNFLKIQTAENISSRAPTPTGFRVDTQAVIDNIAQSIEVEAKGSKTGLIVGSANLDFSKLTVHLKDLTNGTVGDARIEIIKGASAKFSTIYADQGKCLVQTNSGASTSIQNLYVGNDAIVNLQTNGSSETVSQYELSNVVIGDNAKVRLSVYGNNAAAAVTGKDVSITLGKNSIADFGGYKEEAANNWVPAKAGFNAESLTVYVKDPTSSSVVYLSGVEGQVTTDVSAIRVVGVSSANTGDSLADLERLTGVIKLNEKGEPTDGDKASNFNENMVGQTVVQEANDIFDGSTAVVGSNGQLEDVKVVANQNVYGIAEMASLGLHIWRNEIDDMNKRMGELRDSMGQANGVWTRIYNGRAELGSQNISNKYTAFQFGYDHQVAHGVWLGGAVSYTDGNNDFSVGGGDNSLLAFTAYGSWLADNGFFLDVTGKVGRMKNSFDIGMSDFTSSGNYHTNAFSLSAEAGWRFNPTETIFVEPQVELMYGRVNEVDYTTSTGLNVNQHSAQTLIGRAGFMLGLKCPNNRGNAYVRASVLHDWKGDAEFSFANSNGNARSLVEELGGTWYEYGIGVNFNATKRTHVYADVEASSGGEVDTDYRINLGVRYAW